MSIATDLARIQTAKADLKTAIEGKGVTVPSATKIDGYADLVDAIQTGGGGGSKETGSFIASSPLDGVTISVSSKKSHVEFWIHGMSGNMDLSGAPYGTNKLVYFYANDSLQINTKGQVNYAGTALGGGFDKTATSGVNTVSFQDDKIVISMIRIGGQNRPMVDGATYDWEAW